MKSNTNGKKSDNTKIILGCFCDKPKPKIFIKGKKYDILKCRNCGLIYAGTTFSKLDEKRNYNSHKIKQTLDTSPIEIDDSKDRVDSIEKILKKKNIKSKGLKLLDFGTGRSNFLYIAKSRGFDCYGLDVSKDIVLLHKQNHMKMINLDEIKDNSFDIITLYSVFEHIPNPLEILSLLRSKLKKRGIIVIDVPNSNSPDIRFFKKSVNIDLEGKGHVYYYTFRTISRVLSMSGFNVIKKNYKGVFGIGRLIALNNKVFGNTHVHVTYSKFKKLSRLYKNISELLGISDGMQIIAQKNNNMRVK